MNKQLYTLMTVALALMAGQVTAQQYDLGTGTAAAKRIIRIPEFDPSVSKTAVSTAKLTAAKEPLLSKATFNFEGTGFLPLDSSRFTYSGGRTSQNEDDVDSIAFDQMSTWIFNKAFSKYELQRRSTRSYTTGDHILDLSTEKLDAGTGTFDRDRKVSYTYDAAFNITEALFQTWNEATAAWENTSRTTTTYNSANKPLVELDQQWVSASWKDQSKRIHTYNATNQELSFLAMGLYAGVLTNITRTTNTYDASDNVLTTETENWNTGTSAWEGSNKTAYTYNAAGKVTNSINRIWVSGAYVNWMQRTSTYDGAGLMDVLIIQGWDATGSKWVNQQKYYMFTWSASGKNLKQTIAGWASATSSWTDFARYTRVYDAMENLLSNTYESYDFSISSWVNNQQTLHTYSSDNDRLTDIDREWSEPDAAWINNTRSRYTWNGSHQKTRLLTDRDFGSGWHYENGDLLTRYHYTETGTAIPEQNASASMKVYPVPANDQCQLSVSMAAAQDLTITLYDISGRIWQQQTQHAQQEYTSTMDLRQLPAGKYMLHITGSEGANATASLLIVH